jgi:hypothetical protein
VQGTLRRKQFRERFYEVEREKGRMWPGDLEGHHAAELSARGGEASQAENETATAMPPNTLCVGPDSESNADAPYRECPPLSAADVLPGEQRPPSDAAPAVAPVPDGSSSVPHPQRDSAVNEATHRFFVHEEGGIAYILPMTYFGRPHTTDAPSRRLNLSPPRTQPERLMTDGSLTDRPRAPVQYTRPLPNSKVASSFRTAHSRGIVAGASSSAPAGAASTPSQLPQRPRPKHVAAERVLPQISHITPPSVVIPPPLCLDAAVQ